MVDIVFIIVTTEKENPRSFPGMNVFFLGKRESGRPVRPGTPDNSRRSCDIDKTDSLRSSS